MKVKGYYFLYSPINTKEPDGIEKKIMAQRQMFADAGVEMEFELLHRDNRGNWKYEEKYSRADFIYFRRSTTIDWRFISFYKKIKHNGQPVIFMEIPTFPYEGEYGTSLWAKIRLHVDHFFRRFLKRCVDCIVITGSKTGGLLWGVKTIDIINGIDFAQNKPRLYQEHEGINLACIAKFSPWHGYERLIMGLYNYFQRGGKENVNVLMVGEGVEKPYYEELVEKYNLQNHVCFLGKLTGEKLEHVYDVTDLGICSLGRYKSGIDIIGDLKSREFMAKGIPMVCGCRIDALEGKDYPYALFFPNNDSVVDIESLLTFYASFSGEIPMTLTHEIREMTRPWIDYGVTYKVVIDEAVEKLKMGI